MLIDIHTHRHEPSVTTPTSVGIHPWQAENANIDAVLHALNNGIDVIGEVGLDYHCSTPRDIQQRVFEAQTALAEQYHKPVIIHCVRALSEILATLKRFHLPVVIFHGFIGSMEQAKEILDRGYYISFGERTFASPKTIRALNATPLNRLFVESDESTMPFTEILQHIAELRSVSVEDLKKAIENNYYTILKREQ